MSGASSVKKEFPDYEEPQQQQQKLPSVQINLFDLLSSEIKPPTQYQDLKPVRSFLEHHSKPSPIRALALKEQSMESLVDI